MGKRKTQEMNSYSADTGKNNNFIKILLSDIYYAADMKESDKNLVFEKAKKITEQFIKKKLLRENEICWLYLFKTREDDGHIEIELVENQENM